MAAKVSWSTGLSLRMRCSSSLRVVSSSILRNSSRPSARRFSRCSAIHLSSIDATPGPKLAKRMAAGLPLLRHPLVELGAGGGVNAAVIQMSRLELPGGRQDGERQNEHGSPHGEAELGRSEER